MATIYQDDIFNIIDSKNDPQMNDMLRDIHPESPESPESIDVQQSDKYPSTYSSSEILPEISDKSVSKGSISTLPGQRSYSKYDAADSSYTGDGMQADGYGSLFNNNTLFVHSYCETSNDFYDIQGEGGAFEHSENQGELSLQKLLMDFSDDKAKRTPYYANDFLYTKFWDKLPLNRLITLRRYPHPVYNNYELSGIESEDQHTTPIAQAVTWFGEPTANKLSSILKINGKIPWKTVTADVWDVQSANIPSAESVGDGMSEVLNKISFGMGGRKRFVGKAMSKAYVSTAKIMTIDGKNPNSDLSGAKNRALQANKMKYDFNYTHKVWGPINVINQTHTRDRGMGATLSFKLVFNYQLKSYNNINPKLAMIDLISNMLVLVFSYAKFWGGMNRFHPAPMAQFGMLGDVNEFYKGNYSKYMDSVKTVISSAFGEKMDNMKGLFQNLITGNWQDLLQSVVGGTKNLGNAALDMTTAKSKPNVIATHALVSGIPVGEYHVTIGNPYNPIATIGNLICEDFNITPGDDLGFDDFPTEWNVEISLKQARPMDSADIQSIFNLGRGRTYVPPAELVDKMFDQEGNMIQNTISLNKDETAIHETYLPNLLKAQGIV